MYERGFTNTVNALAAIDHCVFQQRSLSLSEVVAAMRNDFSAPAVRAKLRAAPKWGSGDRRVRALAHQLLEMRERVCDAVDAQCGSRSHAVCHVVRSLHRLDGARLAATPDGRRAGEPLCDSIGAETGTATSGPTAVLEEVGSIEACRYYRGGYNLNLTLLRAQTSPSTVQALVEAFFAQGGQELQINALDAEELREAQRDPQRYGDLVVRVAGLSSRFIDLSRTEQDEIIGRVDAALA